MSLSRVTHTAGWSLFVVGVYLLYLAWSVSLWLTLGAALVVMGGLLLATLKRSLVFDRAAGLLQVEQGALGFGNVATVPLFHLRAVVIMARTNSGIMPSLLPSSRYVAYLDRRIGQPIYLDESRRCATLLRMAEAIAEVAELRLEYDAMSHASSH